MQLQFQKNNMILLQVRQNEGLGEKVVVQFKDYREINNKYTNIASIEMFEAVGKQYWQNYFEVIRTFSTTVKLHYK